MSKWRPVNKNCLYVIPDVHGMYDELEVILKRILPLRKSSKGFDKLIMLGDYIDRRAKSPLVIDKLIELKEEYPSQIVLLMGNHEKMFLDALKPSTNSAKYLMWMKNGGEESLYGYLRRKNSEVQNPYLIERQRLSSYIPKEHIKFCEKLEYYHETDDFIFVHAGCDPYEGLFNQDKEVLIWDRSVYNTVKYRLFNPLPWEKCVVTGHNCEDDGRILIRDKFMMLDRSSINELMVMEVNSRQAMVAKRNKKRLVKMKI